MLKSKCFGNSAFLKFIELFLIWLIFFVIAELKANEKNPLLLFRDLAVVEKCTERCINQMVEFVFQVQLGKIKLYSAMHTLCNCFSTSFLVSTEFIEFSKQCKTEICCEIYSVIPNEESVSGHDNVVTILSSRSANLRRLVLVVVVVPVASPCDQVPSCELPFLSKINSS